MGSVLPAPEAPGPDPGGSGHFDHHDWLTDSVKALDARLDVAVPSGMVLIRQSVAINSGGAATANQAITWPPGTFSAPPFVSANTVGTGVWVATLNATPTATGATVGIRHIDNTATAATVTVQLLALGPA